MRAKYTKAVVRDMNLRRKSAVPKSIASSPADIQTYRQTLGELLAAGHMNISGHIRTKVETRPVFELDINPIIGGSDIKVVKRTIEFDTPIRHKDGGEKPHMTGYLESGNEIDKRYRLKGWFNEDGTIRLELVK